MRLRNAGGYSQRRMEKAETVKEAASNSLHILANGGTRGMATKIHKEGTTVKDVKRLKLGRAATKLNSCSKEKGEETLRNFLIFYFSSILVLHASLGGVKAPQQQKRYTQKDRRREMRKRKENSAANGYLFYFIHFSPATRRHYYAPTQQQQHSWRRQSKQYEKCLYF